MAFSLANVKFSFFDRLQQYNELCTRTDSDPEDLAERRLELIRHAKQAIESKTSPEAINWYGTCYIHGTEGFPVNIDLGIRYLNEAIMMRHMNAVTTLAELRMGMITTVPPEYVDYDKAIDLFTRASEQNDGFANARLAYLYSGVGTVPKDIRRALDYLEKSALHQGHPQGLFLMARWTYEGVLLQRDDAKAYDLFSQVYEKEYKATGYPSGLAIETMFFMGLLMLFGEKVPHDEAKGYDYIQRSAYYMGMEATEWLRNNPVPEQFRK
jgi:TPR repeat protein